MVVITGVGANRDGTVSQGHGQNCRNTPGTCGNLRRPDRLLAVQLYQRGVPLHQVENALVLAAVRRFIRPADAPPLATVRSLAYFLPVIDEVLEMEVGEEYFQYAWQKLQRLRSS